ncbi:hypothetical protein R1T16_14665 [Flavobacterium sp. DG1-102-2]|uniref:tetratricopeptide repeat protein n=1 Tax=Flavobacterium sp. DG1-102-2 TaxID=3081663 RepID=UPI002948CE11|nr:hypothetical protein [Flavobacterium sp. DG1-102-2]MDV6169677.1 hypothetical protein [Flavobacterium sp. DG1-102-2]
MKKALVIVLVLSINLIFSQDYFKGKNLYCESSNPEAAKLFKTGIETLYLNSSLDPKYLKMTSDVFMKAFQADTTFCDAMFFAGYTRRLYNDKYALVCYYVADSLAGNRSIEFKTNLAAEALRVGNEQSLKIARKKYNEIIEYFPDSPEGYYGFAITSPNFGDTDKGLENIEIAIKKYTDDGVKIKNDIYFIKGILLTLNKLYGEGLIFFEKSYSDFKKDDSFNAHYSLCLLKVAEYNNDARMKIKAKKIYDKIEHKDMIPEEVKDLLVF